MTSLKDIEDGSTVTVSRIASSSSRRLQRLASLGIVPGVRLRLMAKRPTFVLEFDYTSLAIDGEVASEIFVTR
jgi:DtxR family transcriptional regulator, Mn-dependent transcriptional regulator